MSAARQRTSLLTGERRAPDRRPLEVAETSMNPVEQMPSCRQETHGRRGRGKGETSKDKLALVAGQFLLKLTKGERQCCHFISSHKATSLYLCSLPTSCAPWCMPVICAQATAFRQAGSSLPCWACIAPRWPTP